MTESSPLAPSNDRSQRRVAAEAAAQAWCAERGVRCVVLRVPGIYGPWRLPLDRLRRGEPALRPEDAGPGNRIHLDDLVTACAAALERPVAGVFNVTDGDPATTTEFLQRTAALAGLAVAASATASRTADGKANIDKYRAVPVFTAPGPAFDASKAKGKVIFNIPVASYLPFVVNIRKSM